MLLVPVTAVVALRLTVTTTHRAMVFILLRTAATVAAAMATADMPTIVMVVVAKIAAVVAIVVLLDVVPASAGIVVTGIAHSHTASVPIPRGIVAARLAPPIPILTVVSAAVDRIILIVAGTGATIVRVAA
jgi:hypothetical protein